MRMVLDSLYRLSGLAGAVMLCLILLMVIAQMIARWIEVPVTGLTAIAGYCMAATSFFGLGAIPLDSASVPRRQLETQLHSQRKDVMSSHPGLQQFTFPERFVPLLDKVLDEKVPALMGHMLASAASGSSDDAVTPGALPSS